MLVIADTSPLNYLVWIESVEILPQIYGKVVIPREVCDELLAADGQRILQAGLRFVPPMSRCVKILAGGFSIWARGPRWHWRPLGSQRFS
jgi:hypothetical protein